MAAVRHALQWILAGSLALVVRDANALAAQGDHLDRSKLVLTFAEQFGGPLSRYNPATRNGRWKTSYDFGFQGGGPSSRTLGDELEVYSDPSYNGVNPFVQGEGSLDLTAALDREPKNPLNAGKRFTSGLLTTSPSFKQAYGYFELKAALPQGAGLWPAFWLTAPLNPAISAPQFQGEIDVMEMLGKDPATIYCSAHWPQDQTALTQRFKTLPVQVAETASPHTYGVLWTHTDLVWFVDDEEVARMANPGLDRPMMILINLAVGGHWGGPPTSDTRFPARMRLFALHVYRLRS